MSVFITNLFWKKVEQLTNNGANVNVENIYHMTPLAMATNDKGNFNRIKICKSKIFQAIY